VEGGFKRRTVSACDCVSVDRLIVTYINTPLEAGAYRLDTWGDTLVISRFVHL